jgi:ATPase subunit of ABC transporter with duplicated ATPase domains
MLTYGILQMTTVRDINIAVVGAAGVGKTTFIERTYDLRAPAKHGEVHSLTVIVDRAPCSVSLVEVDWNSIDFEQEVMKWPRVNELVLSNISELVLMTTKGGRWTADTVHRRRAPPI